LSHGSGDSWSPQTGHRPRRRALTCAIWAPLRLVADGLWLPAVQQVRDGEPYVGSAHHLQQIGIALVNYHAAAGRLPRRAIRGKGGETLLSWRVQILPFLEQEALYQKFRLDEPWDSPHNLHLMKEMPQVYTRAPWRVTEAPFATHYQVFAGPGTAFEGDGPTWDDFPDGRGNTLLVVEAAEAVPWTKPADLDYSPKLPVPQLGLGH